MLIYLLVFWLHLSLLFAYGKPIVDLVIDGKELCYFLLLIEYPFKTNPETFKYLRDINIIPQHLNNKVTIVWEAN